MRFGRLLSLGLPALLLGQCAPQCTPAPPPPPPAATFGPGIHLVGRDVQPGTYYARATDSCYWARLSGLGGTFDEIITNDIHAGLHLVTIAASDVGFEAGSRCGTWTQYSGGAVPEPRITEGDWHVGQNMTPGRWATESTTTDGCYWERATDFTHEFGELITNDIGDGQRIVDVAATDVRFSTNDRCGAWVQIG